MNERSGSSSRKIWPAPYVMPAALQDQKRYLRDLWASMTPTCFLRTAPARAAVSMLHARIAVRSALRMWAYRSVIAISLIALPKAVLAYDWEVTAHLSEVEGSYVPAEVTVMIDQSAGTCTAGAWLTFSGNPSSNNLPANVQAVYAGLLAALQTGSRIDIYGRNAGCAIEYVHFLSN